MAATIVSAQALVSSLLQPVKHTCIPLRRSEVFATIFAKKITASGAGEDELVEIPVERGRGGSISRRGAVLATVLSAFAGSTAPDSVYPSISVAAEVKQKNLGIDDVKNIIAEDFSSRQYLLTGDLTRSIYKENCKFHDPTGDVEGVQKYVDAVKLLFDPATSKLELLDIGVSGPRTVDVEWRLSGYLNFPWHPYIQPYEGTSRFTVDDDGLIESYSEKWSISLLTAFLQFVSPSSYPKDALKS